MKLWANDIAPAGDMTQHYWCASVDEAKHIIVQYEEQGKPFEAIEINSILFKFTHNFGSIAI